MPLLLDSIFSSVALGHLIVDVMNGQRAVLLVYLSGPLGLSNAGLGLVSTLYLVFGSLSQPFFGILADRIGARWVMSGGIVLMGIFFSLAVIIPGPNALVLLMLASLCSGAFHPAGTEQAILRGRSRFAGRENTSAAYFFFFGQAGGFLGPVVGGPLLDRFGPAGLVLVASLALPIGANAAYRFRTQAYQPTPRSQSHSRSGSAGVLRRSLLPVLSFAVLAAFQSWAQQNMVTFVPKYLSDLGQPPSIYGLVASLFLGGSALGNTLGGALADRVGQRRVLILALALAAIPLYLMGAAGGSAWGYLLVPLAGFLTGATHSVIVVLAQRLIPGGMAFASGLTLGFMFLSGALGTLLSGYLADQWGFPSLFRMTAGIVLCASALALVVRRISETSAPSESLAV